MIGGSHIEENGSLLLAAIMVLILVGVWRSAGYYMVMYLAGLQGVPRELSEAARIDGLSEYGIGWRIIMPLAKPAVVTLLIFVFVNPWNDYMGLLLYLTTDSLKTVQIGLKRFIQQYSNAYTLIIAASLVSLVPVTVAFLSLQRYFIEGIATTGLKG